MVSVEYFFCSIAAKVRKMERVGGIVLRAVVSTVKYCCNFCTCMEEDGLNKDDVNLEKNPFPYHQSIK